MKKPQKFQLASKPNKTHIMKSHRKQNPHHEKGIESKPTKNMPQIHNITEAIKPNRTHDPLNETEPKS